MRWMDVFKRDRINRNMSLVEAGSSSETRSKKFVKSTKAFKLSEINTAATLKKNSMPTKLGAKISDISTHGPHFVS